MTLVENIHNYYNVSSLCVTVCFFLLLLMYAHAANATEQVIIMRIIASIVRDDILSEIKFEIFRID